jgi:transposase-like protein
MALITPSLGYECRNGVVTYFYGALPVFTHAENDLATFRMITSQFIVNGSARVCEISRAFGIPERSVKRAVRRYRDQGVAGFYEPRKTRGPAVLTPDVIEKLQSLLDEGQSPSDAAKSLDLKPDTVSKAVRAGRLRVKKKKLMSDI